MKPTHRQRAARHAILSVIACCCLIVLLLLTCLFACYGQILPAIASWLLGIVALLMSVHHGSEASIHRSLSALDGYRNENLFQ